MEIPTIIHQSYKSEASVPEEWKQYSKALREMNPSWQYKFWSDEDNYNLIKDHYGWFLPTYEAYKWPVQKADACRYFYMHRYGGVYLDFDMEPIRPIVKLIKQIGDRTIRAVDSGGKRLGLILFEEYPNAFFAQNAIFNGFIISPKGHPFWPFVHSCLPVWQEKQNKKHTSKNTHINPQLHCVLRSTGPRFLRDCYVKYKSLALDSFFFAGAVYPWFCANLPRLPSSDPENPWVFYDRYDPKGVVDQSKTTGAWMVPHSGETKASDFPNTYFVHQSGKSWHKDL